MASIKELKTAKGISYKIIVSNGYDIHGKKIVKSTTYKPDTSLTPKQQEKAVQKFALDFEEKVKNGESFDGDKMPFELFAERWLADVKDNLAYSTYEGYEAIVNNRIIPYFKGYKLSKIKIPFVEAFYKELSKYYAYATLKKCDNVLGSMFKTVYCTIKIPKVAEGSPQSCMRNFPILADAFGISLRPHFRMWI